VVRAFVTEAEQTWKAKKSNFYLLASVKTPKCDACSSFSVLIVVSRSVNTQRPITPDMLVESVHRVACGEYLIGSEGLLPRPSARIAVPLKTPHRHGEVDLAHAQGGPVSTLPISPREVEILDHIARGNSNKEIAKSLRISDQTVKNHITSILKKLSVDDRTAAVVHALRHGWITFEPSG